MLPADVLLNAGFVAHDSRSRGSMLFEAPPTGDVTTETTPH